MIVQWWICPRLNDSCSDEWCTIFHDHRPGTRRSVHFGGGFLQESVSLDPHIFKVAAQAGRRNAPVTSNSAATWLHAFRTVRRGDQQKGTFAKDQVIWVAELKPRRFRTKWEVAFMTAQRPS